MHMKICNEPYTVMKMHMNLPWITFLIHFWIMPSFLCLFNQNKREKEHTFIYYVTVFIYSGWWHLT